MKLIDLIELLEKFPTDMRVAQGFGNPHSWRGSYDELAFEPVDDTTVGEMLAEARSAIGQTYTGWKGGDFLMTLGTPVNIDYVGRWSDGAHDQRLYTWMVSN
jgi:hypothetical protein